MNKTPSILVRFLFILCISGLIVPGVVAQTSLKMGVGSNFMGYTKANLELVAGLNAELSPNDLEFELASGVAIDLDRSTGVLVPRFIVPVDLGFNFLYPLGETKNPKVLNLYQFDYFFGLGVSPVVTFGLNYDSPLYYGGPYFKTGFRFKAHTYMTIQVQAQQQLLFGGTDWINTNTRVGVDVLLSLPSAPPPTPVKK